MTSATTRAVRAAGWSPRSTTACAASASTTSTSTRSTGGTRSTSDEETLSALTDLQRAGKIRYFGSSTFPAYRIVQAQWAARDNHLSRYVTEQPSYSILQRGAETHVLPVTEQYGLGVLAWSPLASGWLSGAIRAGREITTSRSTFMPQRFDTTIPVNRARLDAVEQLAKVADEAGLTMIQLALGFVTAHPAVTSAIIGPRTDGPPARSLAAADTVLSADVLDAIDAIVAPGPTSPRTRSTTLRPPYSTRHCDAADGAAPPGSGSGRPHQQVSYRDVLRVWREADTIPQIEQAWLFDHLMPIGGDPKTRPATSSADTYRGTLYRDAAR